MLGLTRRLRTERELDVFEIEESRGTDLKYSVSMENDAANNFVNEFFDDFDYNWVGDTY